MPDIFRYDITTDSQTLVTESFYNYLEQLVQKQALLLHQINETNLAYLVEDPERFSVEIDNLFWAFAQEQTLLRRKASIGRN